jgi:hypothetical protein
LTDFVIDRIQYDPFSPWPASAHADVILSNSEAVACPVRIAMTPGDPSFILTSGGDALQGSFNTPGGMGAHGFQHDALAAPGVSTVTFNVEIAPGQVVPPGAYSAILTSTLVDETGDAASTFDQRSTEFTADTQARVEVGIATGSGENWTVVQTSQLDLGELTTGDVGLAFIQVRGNTHAQIRVSSATASTLVREDAEPAEAPIGFSVRLDSTPLAIATGFDEIQRMPTATLAGSLYLLEVTIGAVQGRYAGQYSGVVEIDVLAE